MRLVGVKGFEPAAHWSQTSCATKLRYTPKKWCSDSELNQGHGDFQSPALPTELSEHIILMKLWWAIRDLNPGPAGYEPDALTN